MKVKEMKQTKQRGWRKEKLARERRILINEKSLRERIRVQKLGGMMNEGQTVLKMGENNSVNARTKEKGGKHERKRKRKGKGEGGKGAKTRERTKVVIKEEVKVAKEKK